MTTDRLPRSKVLLREFEKSDRMTSMALPGDDRLMALAKDIEKAMLSGQRTVVSRACHEFLATASEFYGVPVPTARVLASRPFRVTRVVGARSFLEIMTSEKMSPESGCERQFASKLRQSERS